jgi:hypothetical protein
LTAALIMAAAAATPILTLPLSTVIMVVLVASLRESVKPGRIAAVCILRERKEPPPLPTLALWTGRCPDA